MSGTFDEVAWSSWRPNVVATLLFVVADGRILLIRKKRGLGAGKVNGPGGKVDPGETPLEAACREVEEEVGVTVEDVVACGELSFQFVDGLALHCHVFRSPGLRGVLRETDEAAPFWASVDAIPYDEMWADDRIWMPELLAGRRFHLRALFDADRMLGWSMDVDPG